MSNTDIVPVGIRVRYHGSLGYMHGEYVVQGVHRPYGPVEAYPGGVAYMLGLGPVGGGELSNVRRSSFTVAVELERMDTEDDS